MLVIPTNLGALAKVAANGETRYAMNCIKLEELPENQYRACATDGKQAVIVTGPGEDPDKFPRDTNAHIENSAVEALIPAKFWKPQDPKLDRAAVAEALKAGETVPGASLSNGGLSLSIRVK